MLTVFGHPFASIGMGEQLRSSLRALRALQVPYDVVDIYKLNDRSDHEHRQLALSAEVDKARTPIRLFHINGDEVDACLRTVEARGTNLADGYNIIMPAWELGRYPDVWARQLARFDEVWSISKFVQEALRLAGIDSVHIGQACQYQSYPYLPRRHFGIRESAFVFLHFFDLTSYRSRKNPEAVIALFQSLLKQRPFDDLQLVLKIKGSPNTKAEIRSLIGARSDRIHVVDTVLPTFETLSLINACDCFVSLHRAEGFGRGGAEAMLLGRLTMATAWSGNLDYMTDENSLMVRYSMVPVGAGSYPHGEGQEWADADLDHALAQALRVVDDASEARRIAALGHQQALLTCGNRGVGIRMLDALEAIQAKQGTSSRREPG